MEENSAKTLAYRILEEQTSGQSSEGVRALSQRWKEVDRGSEHRG